MGRILAGRARGRRLGSPPGLETRPTSSRVKKSLFDILAPRLLGARFLDLCAGAGGVGLEALSRGAAGVVLVEESSASCALIRKNAEILGLPGAEVVCQDARVALRGLARAGASFDVVFLDPPYESDVYEALLELVPGVLSEDGVVIAEHFKKRPLAERIGPLERLRAVRIGDHTLTFMGVPRRE
jgi:16S rRNA (guanine966-N2)-methyltransferase